MRKVMRSVVVGVTFSVGGFGWTGLPGEPPAAYAQETVPWMTNLDQARQIAQQNQRLVLIHFWNDNCPPCIGVERNVFSRPEVARGITANYVPVKIKVDDQPELARRLRVDRWPLDIFITPEGQVLSRTVSPQDPLQYLSVADGVAASAKQTLASTTSPGASPDSSGRPIGNSAPAPAAGYVPSNYAPSNYAPPGANSYASPSGPPQPSNPSVGPNGGFAPAGYSPGGAAPATGPYGAAPVPAQPAAPPSAIPGGQFVAPPSNNFAPPGGDRSAFNPNAAAPDGSFAPSPSAAQAQFAMANGTGGSPPASFASASQPAGFGPSQSAPNMPPVANFGPNASPPNPAPAAAANPPLGLDGFCPVTLYEKKKWKRADSRWGVVHRDRTYLFAGPDEQKKFLASPDKFSPMLSGFDPVHYLDEGKLVSGRREHGVWYQDQMFLFADEASLQQFWTAPGRYIPRVEQAMRATATSGLMQR